MCDLDYATDYGASAVSGWLDKPKRRCLGDMESETFFAVEKTSGLSPNLAVDKKWNVSYV